MEAHGDVRTSPTTKPSSSSSSSSPSVGLKKAPTSRARDPSSRRCGGGRPRWRAAAPKPWWEYEEALARLAFELRGEAAAQRASHTNSCGQRRLALRARGGWRPGEPPSARRLPPRLSSRASIHSSCVRSHRRTWRQQPQRPARRIERRGARYGAWRGRGERGGRRGAVFARLSD